MPSPLTKGGFPNTRVATKPYRGITLKKDGSIKNHLDKVLGTGSFGSQRGRIIVSVKSSRGPLPHGADERRASAVRIRSGKLGWGKSKCKETRKMACPCNVNLRGQNHHTRAVDQVTGKVFYPVDMFTSNINHLKGLRNKMMSWAYYAAGRGFKPGDRYVQYIVFADTLLEQLVPHEWKKIKEGDEARINTALNAPADWKAPIIDWKRADGVLLALDRELKRVGS
jgi:hypothetical protein